MLTVGYLIGVLRQLPCRQTVVGQDVDSYKWMCYSDIPLLYRLRGLVYGNTPYLDSGNYPPLEYPVLTGWFLELERRITVALGAPTGQELTEQQQLTASAIFFDVNMVVLFVLALITVLAQLQTTTSRPWDAMMLAASPCLALASLINWDLLPVALTALGCLYWSRSKPVSAGIMLGLGMAAKLYPALLLGPLLLLCLRGKRMRAFGAMFAAFAASWMVVNLPVIILAPRQWLSFWSFNSDRGGDLGSIWYVISLAGHSISHLNALNAVLFLGACAGIGIIIVVAPRRPRFGQVAFLVLAAFLMTNKVYSPQYMLWLLPFVILARPRWREWWVFTAGEVIYFGAIWWHLGGQLTPGAGGPDKVYWSAVILRLATQSWVAAIVIRDIFAPQHDPLRVGGQDDPAGGVLNRAPDADWAIGVSNRVRAGLPR